MRPHQQLPGNMINQRSMEMRKKRRSSLSGSSELPWDVWANILSRLPVKSILQGRSVCRAWRDLLAHPDFTKAHSQRSEQHPTLLYCSPVGDRDVTYVEIIGDGSNGGGNTSSTSTNPGSSPAAAVMKLKGYGELVPVATCNGVVCFCSTMYRNTYLVGNPLVDRVEDLVHVKKSEGHGYYRLGGFGFSPETKRYKIVDFYFLGPEEAVDDVYQIRLDICTMGHRGDGEHTWRNLGPFPHCVCRPDIGSYLDGGIHWLICDRHPAFISRLDLHSEQFERLPAPESEEFQLPHIESCKRNMFRPRQWFEEPLMMGMRLGVSGGHLIICTNVSDDDCSDDDCGGTTHHDAMSIWVRMKESWMKKFVVKKPALIQRELTCVEVLNYGQLVEDDAAGRRPAALVMLFYYPEPRIFVSSNNGQHVRKIPFDGFHRLLGGDPCSYLVIPHVPSLLSIKDT